MYKLMIEEDPLKEGKMMGLVDDLLVVGRPGRKHSMFNETLTS